MNNWIVCRSCHCHDNWEPCDWAGICPHSSESDPEFSAACQQIIEDVQRGNKVTSLIKEYGITLHEFNKYKKAIQGNEHE